MPGKTGAIRAVIADPHLCRLQDTCRILEEVGGIKVAGSVSCGSKLIGVVERLRPDVALIDVSLHGRQAMESARWIAHHRPGTAVVVQIPEEDELYVSYALRAGAGAVVPREAPPRQLVAAVRDALRLRPG